MDQLRFCQWKETLRCFAESVMDDVLSGFNLEYNLEAEPARWSVKNLCIRNGASVISGIRKTEMFYASFSECLVCKVYLKEAVCVSHETNAPGRWCCIMLSSASKSGGSWISQTGAPTPLVGVPTYNFCHFQRTAWNWTQLDCEGHTFPASLLELSIAFNSESCDLLTQRANLTSNSSHLWPRAKYWTFTYNTINYNLRSLDEQILKWRNR